MPSLRWSLLLGLAFVLATSASPIPQESLLEQEELAAQAELTPEIFGVVEDGDRSDRDKRKVLELKVAGGLGVKQFLLDLLFGKINQVIDHKTALVTQLDRTNVAKNLAWGIGTTCGHCAAATAAGGATGAGVGVGAGVNFGALLG